MKHIVHSLIAAAANAPAPAGDFIAWDAAHNPPKAFWFPSNFWAAAESVPRFLPPADMTAEDFARYDSALVNGALELSVQTKHAEHAAAADAALREQEEIAAALYENAKKQYTDTGVPENRRRRFCAFALLWQLQLKSAIAHHAADPVISASRDSEAHMKEAADIARELRNAILPEDAIERGCIGADLPILQTTFSDIGAKPILDALTNSIKTGGFLPHPLSARAIFDRARAAMELENEGATVARIIDTVLTAAPAQTPPQ